jgi:hypothetical protein
MSKMTKSKDASETKKMSKIPNFSKNGKSACSEVNLGKPTKNLTKPVEEVAGPEISPKYNEMSTLLKVMATNNTAVSTHSVSEMRQINMADNI